MGGQEVTDPRAAWRVVERFEEALCEYTGAPHCVAVDSCSNALHLCFERLMRQRPITFEPEGVEIPKLTYVGVVQAARRATWLVEFVDQSWVGEYQIKGTPIVDAARWLRRGMYRAGTWTCLSFHATKHLPIGRGGAILCDTYDDAEWFRRARYDGRDQTRPIVEQQEFQWGMHCYMPPESAARGLLLMTALKDANEPLRGFYPDLSLVRWT